MRRNRIAIAPAYALPVLLLALALLLSGCGGSGGPPSLPDSPMAVPPPSSGNAGALPPGDESTPPEQEAPSTESPETPPPADDEQNASDDVAPAPPPRADAFTRNVPTRNDFRNHPGFINQWALDTINADEAWAALARAKGGSAAPGSGVTVGFLDTGIDHDHPAFRSRRDNVEEEFISNGRDTAVDEDGSKSSHGTFVASIVGADRDRARDTCAGCIHGIAWGADLEMFAIPITGANDQDCPGCYKPLTLGEILNSARVWANIFRDVLAGDADILNFSVSFPGLIDEYHPFALSIAFAEPITVLAQANAQEKTILVWAAGNANDDPCSSTEDWCVNGFVNATSPEVLAGLVAYYEELRGHSIAVVGTTRNGVIANGSNRCGIAADWCIAAPGWWIRGAEFGPRGNEDGVRGWRDRGGTSYSTPMVAGSLAVMKHFFRNQLSNTQLVTRMYATADKTGRYAVREIYGQGLLDLGAAVSPVGGVTVATAGTADTPEGAPLAETRLRLGVAFGDALRHSFANEKIVTFDQLGAPFWYELDSLFEHTRAPGSSRVRFDDFLAAREEAPPPSWADLALATPRAGGGFRLAPLAATWRERGSDASFAYLAHAANAAALSWSGADHGFGATFFATPRGNEFGDSDATPGHATGAVLAWRPPTGGANFGFGLHAGWLAEQDALLGSSATGAFGEWSSDTMFAGFDTSFNLGSRDATHRHGWRVLASAEVGVSEPTPQGGMVEDLPPLTASAFALRAERAFLDGTHLRFSLAQPLRIESDAGGVTLSVPDLEDPEQNGGVRGVRVQKQLTTGLTPSGRQLDASVRWDRPLAPDTELRFGAMWTRHPGHDADAEPEFTLLGGLRHSF